MTMPVTNQPAKIFLDLMHPDDVHGEVSRRRIYDDDAGSFVGYWEYKSLFDRHHEAQAEIARLQTELAEANSCHETAISLANFGAGQITSLQAEVERLTAVNEVRESQANMLGAIRDTAWNEAIEAAASVEVEGYGGVHPMHIAALRALRKNQP